MDNININVTKLKNTRKILETQKMPSPWKISGLKTLQSIRYKVKYSKLKKDIKSEHTSKHKILGQYKSKFKHSDYMSMEA